MWPFRQLAKRRLRIKEEELKRQVAENLKGFFEEHPARFVPNEPYKAKRGLVLATFEVSNLLFEAVSFWDGFYMKVSALHSTIRWEGLGLVLDAIDAEQPITTLADVQQISTYLPLVEIGPLLKRRFPDLVRGLSQANYASTMDKVQRIKDLRQQETNERCRQKRAL